MSKILIIEDEVSIAELEKDYLELSGFEVDMEHSGDTGLDKALKNDFDLIILDLMLPGIDGFEICRRIREQKNIPVLMVSAKKEDIDKIGPLVELGLEPWDNKLTSKYLLDKFKNKRLPIKTVLLDQSIIVGIGNIYADEILFLCKINPLKKCNLITEEEANNIIKYTRSVLEEAIKMGGTTIRTYSSVDGVHGLFQKELLVHGKDKDTCPECNTKIEKIRVGGRGTYYCPNCQK